jgi:hypothetical protein
MKTIAIALTAILLLGATVQAGWYVGPARGYAYYPAAPVYAYAAPTVVATPQVVYSPVYAPAVVAAPVPVLVGPPAVVVRSKVYIPGRPVRNVVRAVVP